MTDRKRRLGLAAVMVLLAAPLGTLAEGWLDKEGVAAQTSATPASGRKALLVKEWSRAKLGVEEYIDAMPEQGIGFRPTPEIRSFAEQYLHIAATLYMFASIASGQENPYDFTKGRDPEKMEDLKASKAALRKFVLESYDYMIQAIETIDEDQMDGDVQFFNQKMSRQLLLAKALEHHAHHRGQTTIYLRLQGITPPSERLF